MLRVMSPAFFGLCSLLCLLQRIGYTNELSIDDQHYNKFYGHLAVNVKDKKKDDHDNDSKRSNCEDNFEHCHEVHVEKSSRHHQRCDEEHEMTSECHEHSHEGVEHKQEFNRHYDDEDGNTRKRCTRKSSRKRKRKCRKNYAAKRADLLSAMDGRNAFVLGQKANPQINAPVKPAPAEELELLNSTTLAKLPGGWKEIVKQENKTSTRDIETGNVFQKKPKTGSPIYKQFLQEEPMILRPSIFPIPEQAQLSLLAPLDPPTPINTTSGKSSICNTTEVQKVSDSSDACGYQKQASDPVKEELKEISHDLLHSRVSEVINHGKEVELIKNGSAQNITGQIDKSMGAHEIQNTKISKHKPLKHWGDDKNAVVLLNILTPEEAKRLPYLVNDKKKNVPKLKKISNGEDIRKNAVHKMKTTNVKSSKRHVP